ncbi:MAG: hypothetical protein ACP5KW_07535 [Thermoproteota archaeon]|jgi:hypothetical protein
MNLPKRVLLTILVWGLILEILTLVYYLSTSTWRFEFVYTFFLLVITLIALVLLVKQMKSELDKQSSKD